jgi:hypothetical protein
VSEGTMMSELARITKTEAQKLYRPGAPSHESEPKSELERQLRLDGIAEINLGIDTTEFQELSDQYALCINEHEELLEWTAGSFDDDGVPEDGHVKKTIKFNDAKMQIVDPKSLFHFNNSLWNKWSEKSRLHLPAEFRGFMEHGFHLHSELTLVSMRLIDILDESYVGMKDLFFPALLSETTFRLIRYDGYYTHNEDGKLIVEQDAEVAKPHYDRGGMTIQAYASAKGFWRQPEGARGRKYPKFYPAHGENQSQTFFGEGFRSVYGSHTPIHPLYHGVDRIFDENLDYIPDRTAAILFTDAPLVDLDIKSIDTQPERVDKDKLNI